MGTNFALCLIAVPILLKPNEAASSVSTRKNVIIFTTSLFLSYLLNLNIFQNRMISISASIRPNMSAAAETSHKNGEKLKKISLLRMPNLT